MILRIVTTNAVFSLFVTSQEFVSGRLFFLFVSFSFLQKRNVLLYTDNVCCIHRRNPRIGKWNVNINKSNTWENIASNKIILSLWLFCSQMHHIKKHQPLVFGLSIHHRYVWWHFHPILCQNSYLLAKLVSFNYFETYLIRCYFVNVKLIL